jgi:hypothetical protein
MKKAVIKFSWIFLLFIASQSFAQKMVFPSSWEGNYQGELHIYGVDSITMKLTMKLVVQKKTDSVYDWKMTYLFNGKEDIRPYEIIVKDAEKGYYLIDEKNSILIDGYYKTGIFTSFFEVNQSFIISTYTKIDNAIIFEIIAADGKSKNISGNSEVEGQSIPEVTSFLVNGRQKAILYKQ